MAAKFDAEEFVEVIYDDVYLSAVEGSVRVVDNPPGRNPSPALLDLNRWFACLSESDRKMTIRMMRMAADFAVFGFFCVLDGARPITDGFSREAILTIVGEGEEIVLSPDGDLHDIFRAIVDERRESSG